MVEWIASSKPVSLPDAVTEMERRVGAIADHREDEAMWLLEHPPVITSGTSGRASHVLNDSTLPVYKVSRGGQVTYHGPGQRVAYLMLDLNRRRRDVRHFVNAMEQWVILTLSDFGIEGFTRCGRVGVWVHGPDGNEQKIAAIGIRLRRWITFHGVSLNVAPDLQQYSAIIPCGLRDFGMTSMAALGKPVSMDRLDAHLQRNFFSVFGEADNTTGNHPVTAGSAGVQRAKQAVETSPTLN